MIYSKFIMAQLCLEKSMWIKAGEDFSLDYSEESYKFKMNDWSLAFPARLAELLMGKLGALEYIYAGWKGRGTLSPRTPCYRLRRMGPLPHSPQLDFKKLLKSRIPL